MTTPQSAMPHTFEVRVDRSMSRRAWNAWFFRNPLWIGVAVALVFGSTALDLRDGRLGAGSAFNLKLFGSAVIVFWVVYMIGLRRVLSKHEAIVDGRATYTLSEATIGAASSMGSIALAWSTVDEVRRYRDLVLVRFKGTVYSTIPAADIPADALAFLVAQARAAGARITGY